MDTPLRCFEVLVKDITFFLVSYFRHFTKLFSNKVCLLIIQVNTTVVVSIIVFIDNKRRFLKM